VEKMEVQPKRFKQVSETKKSYTTYIEGNDDF
jgi:hypothetical protein